MTFSAVLVSLMMTQSFPHQPVPSNYLNRMYASATDVNQALKDDEPSGEPLQVIKMQLERSGPDDEWIRIEIRQSEADMVNLSGYHTTRVRRGLLSDIVNGVIGTASPVPIPIGVNFHRWADHPTLALTFQPDRCPSSFPLIMDQSVDLATCTIMGIDNLTLPADVDIYAGSFTIRYEEEGLIRAIAFRLPVEDE